MALTWVKICNLALSMIGQAPISQLTDSSKAAVACNALYELARDTVLQEADWNCARKGIEISASVTAPPFSWDYIYVWPVDCIAVRKIEGDPPYELQGRTILTDQEDSIQLTYTSIITDPTLLTPKLADLIATKLAELLIPQIRPSLAKENAMIQLYAYKKPKAIAKEAEMDYQVDSRENDGSRENAEWIKEGR